MKYEIRYRKDFFASLQKLFHKGGQFQKAATEVQALIGRMNEHMGFDDPFAGMNLTHHGEGRIRKCWKYDLNGYARLITIKDNGIVLLCFVGNHQDCVAWLDRNRGLTLIADEHERLNAVQMSLVYSDAKMRLTGPSALGKGKLYEHLPDDYFDRLVDGIQRKVVRQLENVESIHDEGSIYNIIKEITDGDRAHAIFDVFILLRQDKRKEALDRLKLFLGESRAARDLTEQEIAELADSDTIKTSGPMIGIFNEYSSTSSSPPPTWTGCCFSILIRKPW